MKRLAEWLVGLGIIGGIVSATAIFPQNRSGSWGVEPNAEVRRALDSFLAMIAPSDARRQIASRRIIRASAPITIYDDAIKQRIRAIKVEIVEEFKPGISFGSDLPLRRYILVIGYDGDKMRRWFYEGKGPKEYREAF